ncbi:MAG: NAD(P)H-dependent oxidoreductase [Hyphomicrobiaceae bacterium]
MSLSRMLAQRAADSNPIRIGQVGAGKFGTMFLSQLRLTKGMQLVGLADLQLERTRERLMGVEWPATQLDAMSVDAALKTGKTFVTESAQVLVEHPEIDVIVEATGNPTLGIELCLAAIEHGKHIVMVNVEADALAGPLLAKRAAQKGVVYSLAWGDQPALICEHVDWARTCGFEVVAAGKGTRYMPTYHASTPDTVWEILDTYLKIQDRSHINPKMFNSFVDGTKSGIEMTAVCNSTGLVPQSNGLGFPPASRFEHAEICKPKADGGVLEKAGVTEVTSSVYRDGTDVPHNLAMGTYVVITSDSNYARSCITEYNCLPDSTGKYGALYRPTHMIGLELGYSIASVVLRNEPTGAPICFNSVVVATAKRALKAGEMLDGEGGACVWGKQTPAVVSLEAGYLPLGLSHDVKLKRDVEVGEQLKWDDVELDQSNRAVQIRREMESHFCRTDVNS